MKKLNWQKEKPKLKKECLLLTATYWAGYWDYVIFQIIKTDFEDKWYLGLFDGTGDEWGDYIDFKADLYCILPKLKNK